MRRIARALGLLGAVGLAAGLAQTHAAPAPVVQEVRVTLREWAVEPREITVRPGRVRFVVRNAGQRQHNLSILGPGQASDVKVTSDNVGAGATLTFEVDLPRAGTYLAYCDIEGHRDRGIEGRLVVGSASTAPARPGSPPAFPAPPPMPSRSYDR
ncbi:MAG: cupredoxin domain-containing protein [Armatimonadetes bacterium]|nr:cupredoxin domain-containing protein [Armatimonadota bacterium]